MNNNFNIIFIGGSITEGAGVSMYENSYVYKVSEYLKILYQDKKVNIINSGVSGTGSNFGVFRLKRDVIDNDPDLVFIEFAVNDRIFNPKEVSISMEGIVRSLLKLDVPPAIIFLIIPTEMSDACGDVHKKIAYYYDIPVVDIQDHIFREIGKGDISWNYISCDSLHPNDLGNKLYADYIISFLKENDITNLKRSVLHNPPLMKYEFNNPRLVSYEAATFYGNWKEENFHMKKRIEMAAVSEVIGDCIEFSFKGRCLGITTLQSKDCGVLEVNIDGDKYELDLYSQVSSNFVTAINLRDLQDTDHLLVLRVSEKRNPNSNGNKIIIGDFILDR